MLRLGLFCLAGLSAACVHLKVPPACRAACDARASSCEATCRSSCVQCGAFANQWATDKFARYEHEKYVEGGIIARELKSYRDPLQCRKHSCNCKADYQICIQSCAGVIFKRFATAPVC